MVIIYKMGGNQSNRIKIQETVMNKSPTIKAGVLQSDQQVLRSRNQETNNLYQQQHTLAKRIRQETINFKK